MSQNSSTSKKLTKEILIEALTRLGDLLDANGRSVELTVAGGTISVLHFQNREMTEDVDVMFRNEADKTLVLSFVKQISEELSLHPEWLNDEISRIDGFRVQSSNVIFQAKGLILTGPHWIEWLAQKINRFDELDLNDAKEILQRIPNKNKSSVWRMVQPLQPKSPRVSKSRFKKRFEHLWDIVYPESSD